MNHTPKIIANSDSIIEILAAQCADLEKLLAIAREQTHAAEAEDFDKMLEIVSERTKIGERLEVFQQKISELRMFLGENADDKRTRLTNRITEIANLTVVQDRKTKLLLEGVKEKTARELNALENNNKNANIYLRGQQTGLAYNGNF